VKEARFGSCGMHLDRAWCIVDRDGTRHRQFEQLSQRCAPELATISVKLPESYPEPGGDIVLSAPGMGSVTAPCDEEGYSDGEQIMVECGSKSTTSSGSWQLGTMPARLASNEVNDWLTKHLNDANPKKAAARYALVRSMTGNTRLMHKYCGPRQAPYSSELSQQRTLQGSPFKMQGVNVHDADEVRFSDFSPCHLASVELFKL